VQYNQQSPLGRLASAAYPRWDVDGSRPGHFFFLPREDFCMGLRGACARKESVRCELKAHDVADSSLDGGNKAHARVAINQGQRRPK
jgi:hypothetical protein